MPRPPIGASDRSRGYAALTSDAGAPPALADQLSTSSNIGVDPQQRRRWRPCPSVEETEMEAEAVRRAWASKAGLGPAVNANGDDPTEQADLLGAFQACDIDGNGTIGAIDLHLSLCQPFSHTQLRSPCGAGARELHAILLAIGAEVSLAAVAAIIAEAEQLTGQDSEIRTAAAAAAFSLPPPRPAAKASLDFGRPFAALTLLSDAARDAVSDATEVAETVATAVREAAEEAAELTGLMTSTREVASRHDGQLDFVEFQRLIRSSLLEPLLAGATSPREQTPRGGAGGGNDPDVAADIALLREHHLEEHIERLQQAELLGELSRASAGDLERLGLPPLHARTLAAVAGLSPAARARQRVGVRACGPQCHCMHCTLQN